MGIDGTYGFVYCGNQGLGIGVFLVEGQHVQGHDAAGSRYDGSVIQDGNGNIHLDVKMLVPEGAVLVQGMAPQDLPHTRQIRWTFPPAFGDGKPQEVDFLGPVTVMVKRIPDENAAIAKDGFTRETTAPLGGFPRFRRGRDT